MTAVPTFLECPINDGHKLRVEFFKSGDRYAHRLSAVLVDEAGESIVPLAESVEGTADDPWPPSPPLQSLSIEELSLDRTAALLVGMSGRSHWSASIEWERNAWGFLCQLACRFTTVPDRLVSTYRIAPGIVLREGKGSALLAHVELGISTIFEGLGGWEMRAHLNNERGEFQFQVPIGKMVPAATAQWRYVILGKKVDPAELRKTFTA